MQTAAEAGLAAYEGTNAAHWVATRRLDLDNVGAHVGHQFAAVDTHGAGQVQHPVATKRLGRPGIRLFTRDGHLRSIVASAGDGGLYTAV